jgi:hypothetical protein
MGINRGSINPKNPALKQQYCISLIMLMKKNVDGAMKKANGFCVCAASTLIGLKTQI